MDDKIILFYIIFGIMVVAFAFMSITAILQMYFAAKFNSYIKREHPDKWKQLITIGDTEWIYANPVRYYKFLWSNELEDDHNLSRLKKRTRSLTKIFVITFIIYASAILILININNIAALHATS